MSHNFQKGRGVLLIRFILYFSSSSKTPRFPAIVGKLGQENIGLYKVLNLEVEIGRNGDLSLPPPPTVGLHS